MEHDITPLGGRAGSPSQPRGALDESALPFRMQYVIVRKSYLLKVLSLSGETPQPRNGFFYY